MKVRFADSELDRLETDGRFTAGLSPDLVKMFRRRMQYIRSAVDERDFYKLTSLHYEKLEGRRSHQHSMRLNDQFRLIVEVREGDDGKTVVIAGIEDYH
jgi:proteic killer suppression protein